MDLLPRPGADLGAHGSIGIDVDSGSTIPSEATHHSVVLGERGEPPGGFVARAALRWNGEARPDRWHEPDHGGWSNGFVGPCLPGNRYGVTVGCESLGQHLGRQAKCQPHSNDQIVSRTALGFKRDDPAAGVGRIDKARPLSKLPRMQAQQLALKAEPMADAAKGAFGHQPAMHFEGGVEFV